MEKRVYDEEVSEPKGETDHPTPVSSTSTTVDFVPRIKEALIHGLPIVRDQNSGGFNCYKSRFLPHILGSEVFIDSPYVGVARRKAPDSNKQSIPTQQLIEKSIVATIRSNTPPSPIIGKCSQQLDEDSLSDLEEVSSFPSKVMPPVVSRESEIEQQYHSGMNNFQDELAARLKIPSSASHTVASTEQSKIEPQVIGVAQQPQPAPRTIIHPPKRRTLFDESSSESEEDLFKPTPPKIPTPTQTLQRPPPPMDRPKTVISVPSSPSLPSLSKVNGLASAVKGGLFGSSDSEDDLFAGITTSTATSTAKRKPAPILLDDDDEEDEDIFSTKTVIPSASSSQANYGSKIAPKVTSNSLFGEEEEDDFFSTKITRQVTQPPPAAATNNEKNMPSSSLFCNVDEDQERPSIKQSLVEPIETAPKLEQPVIVKQSTHVPSKPNIFIDSDSDDEDLFRTIVAKPKRVAVAEPNKAQSASPPEISSKNHQNLFQSTPVKNVTSDSMAQTFLQNSNQEKSMPIAENSKSKPIKAPSLLFNDDSDDEDLFGTVKPFASSSVVKSVEHPQLEKVKPQEKSVQSILPAANNILKERDDLEREPVSLGSSSGATEDITRNGVSAFPIETDSIIKANITEKEFNNTSNKIQSQTEVNNISPLETNVSSSLIASLKLSLSKQPNSLPFLSSPSPVEVDGNSIGTTRKPFGGVSIFGSSTATSPVEQTESEKATPTSEVCPEVGDIQPSSDSLECLGKLRPKAPTSRRPPSRHFRRSVVHDEDNMEASSVSTFQKFLVINL